MRLTADLGAQIPERTLNFLIYVVSAADQFVPVKGNLTLQNIQDRFWKVNKPLEMFYSFT